MSGKVVLVTGASSGIGAACAEMLAKRGFRVYGSSRNPNFKPSGYQALQMDVTDDRSVDEAVAQVIREAGSIDALVNNAGCGLAGAVEDTASIEALHQMDVNFMGPFRAARAILPGMRQRRSGVIVNVSSLGGLFGLPFQSFYSASKFAMEGWTESLRFEVSPFGIRVVLIEPGDVKTGFTGQPRTPPRRPPITTASPSVWASSKKKSSTGWRRNSSPGWYATSWKVARKGRAIPPEQPSSACHPF